MSSNYEKFDKAMNLANDDVDEDHMISIKKMTTKMTTSWPHLINNTLYHYYEITSNEMIYNNIITKKWIYIIIYIIKYFIIWLYWYKVKVTEDKKMLFKWDIIEINLSWYVNVAANWLI